MSTTPEKDAPMPPGVEAMTKQELWNWFHRSTQAAAEQHRLRDKFFTMTTGLHSARSHMLGDPAAIVEAQRARIRGLELQMAQMQKGYDTKLRKALSAHLTPALSLLQRVRMRCIARDAAGTASFSPDVDQPLLDDIQALLLVHRIAPLPLVTQAKPAGETG